MQHQIAFEHFVGQVGARVQVSLGEGAPFADGFRKAFQGVSGTVVTMHREADRPLYGVDRTGRCFRTGTKPGEMIHQVRFDTPVVVPGSMTAPITTFHFRERELVPLR